MKGWRGWLNAHWQLLSMRWQSPECRRQENECEAKGPTPRSRVPPSRGLDSSTVPAAMVVITPDATDASTSVLSHLPAAPPPSITKPTVIKHIANKNKRGGPQNSKGQAEEAPPRCALVPRPTSSSNPGQSAWLRLWSTASSEGHRPQATFHAFTLRTFSHPCTIRRLRSSSHLVRDLRPPTFTFRLFLHLRRTARDTSSSLTYLWRESIPWYVRFHLHPCPR